MEAFAAIAREIASLTGVACAPAPEQRVAGGSISSCYRWPCAGGALFVKIASKFQSEITVEKDGEQINGKSIMGLMMLAAAQGSRLKIIAEGADAEAALRELEQLFAQKFNED